MSLKLLVNTKKYHDPLMAEIRKRIDDLHIVMEQAEKPEDLYKLQGGIAALRKLLTLRGKVNADD